MRENEFNSAVRRNHQRVFLIALSFVKNEADAEDIMQNVFCKLWKYDREFEDEEHTDRWITRVTVNESKNLLRSPFKQRHTSLEDAAEMSVFDEKRDFDLFHAVMKLPKKHSVVLHLFYYEDLPVKDIAKLLGIKESAVKTRLSRGRAQLRKMLGDEWINE